MKRIHLFIYGNVTGVFFRANTQDKAISLGLNGFIKNIEQGKVEAVFEGSKSSIKEIIKFCKNPGFTNINKVEVKEESYKGEFNNFEIVY